MQGRDDKGRFGEGNQFARGRGTGRPPRNYSIAHAMSIFAEEQTIDDGGTPMTCAQLAAKWLWGVVTTGEDRDQAVSMRDRLEALKTILSRIEPAYRLRPGELADAEARDLMEALEELSDEELKVLERLGIRT